MLDGGTMSEYAITDNADEYSDADAYITTKPTSVSSSSDVDMDLIYGESIDLNELVYAWATNFDEEMLVADGGFDVTYTFTNISVVGEDGETDQKAFATLENGVVSAIDNITALGRKPVIQVDAKVGNKTFATAYIRLLIKEADPVALDPIKTTPRDYTIKYTDLTADAADNVKVPFDWNQVNQEIYGVLNMNATEFTAAYNETPEFSAPTGVTVTPSSSFPSDGTSSADLITIGFTNKVKTGNGSFTITYKSNDNTRHPDVVITINYNVVDNHSITLPAYSNQVTVSGNTKTFRVTGQLIGSTYRMSGYLYQAYQSYNDWTPANAKNHTISFRFKPGTSTTGVDMKQDETGQYLKLKSIWTGEKTFTIELIATLENTEVEVLDAFNVVFANPLNMSVMVDGEEGATVEIAADGSKTLTEDLLKYMVIKSLNGQDIYVNKAATLPASQYFGFANSNFSFNFEIDATKTDTGKFSIDATTGELTFVPGGQQIVNDEPATIKVTATVNNGTNNDGDIIEMKATINVVVKP